MKRKLTALLLAIMVVFSTIASAMAFEKTDEREHGAVPWMANHETAKDPGWEELHEKSLKLGDWIFSFNHGNNTPAETVESLGHEKGLEAESSTEEVESPSKEASQNDEYPYIGYQEGGH